MLPPNSEQRGSVTPYANKEWLACNHNKAVLIITKHSAHIAYICTDAVTYAKLYSKPCQYLIQTNHGQRLSLTQPMSIR